MNIRSFERAAFGLAVASVLLVSPTAAKADHDHGRGRGHASHLTHPASGAGHSGAYCPLSRGPGKRIGHTKHHASPYTCGPCNRGFRSPNQFGNHLHRHHRVPWHWMASVLVRAEFGWIFHG